MQSQSAPNALEMWICEQIRVGGPVTVAQYMAWALYHPQYGYYTTGPNIGPRGDFTTSPEASPAFGRLLATHIQDIDRLLGSPPTFDAIECGPGRGTLAADLLDTLKAENPDLYSRLRYWLVEVSPALIAVQKACFLPDHSSVVQWRTGVDGVADDAQGAVIANELVDAFPVHVLANRQGAIMEQYAGLDKDGALTIIYDAPSDYRLPLFLQEQSITLNPGERLEVNLAVDDWLRGLSGVFKRGIITLIDYGDTAPQRYSQARREGTLLGYYGGAVTDSILSRPGKQDLTALVDFTALQQAAREAGFTIVGMIRQAHFLLGLGLGATHTPEAMADNVEAAIQYRRGLQALISMEGLGRFHVLLLSKGVDVQAAARLSALKYMHY